MDAVRRETIHRGPSKRLTPTSVGQKHQYIQAQHLNFLIHHQNKQISPLRILYQQNSYSSLSKLDHKPTLLASSITHFKKAK